LLTVTGSTGAFSFRVLDIPQAASNLTPGTPVSAALTPGNETDIYRFEAVAGDKYYFDHLTESGSGTVYWRLLDPFGNVVFDAASFANRGPLTLGQTGSYTLLIEGHYGNTAGNQSYSFNVQPVTDDEVTGLPLNSSVSGTIAQAGQRDFYRFSLSSATQAYFDVLSNANVTWTLTGPRGVVVSNRAFSGTDAASETGNLLMDLAAGDYTLMIDGTGDMTGPYSFRLSDLMQGAVSLTPGVPVSATLSPGSETDIYRFNATAGDRYYFDYLSQSGSGSVYWRLLDPFGNVVFDVSSFSSEQGPLTLEQTGAYTLLVEGWYANTASSLSYSFNVQPVTDDEVTGMPLNSSVSGGIAQAGQRDFYHFNLSAPAQAYFDVLSSANVRWTLSGPQGAVVSNRAFSGTDSGSKAGNLLMNLAAGDYTLIIDGVDDMTGAYGFRLLDLSQIAVSLTPGTPVSATLAPGSETDVYRFNATAGDRYYFDSLSKSGSGSVYWRLLDPFGNVVFDASSFSSSSDQGPLTLSQSGAYTLLVEGWYTNTAASLSYSFNVQPVTDDDVTGLALNSSVSGSIAQAGQRDFYRFSLSSATQAYFDVLSSSANLNWTLTGPRGTVISNLLFTGTDGSKAGNLLMDLAAGDYTLIIDGVDDMTGTYAFRLMDVLQTAVSLTPGAPVSATLSPGNETDIYRFNATAGDSYFFDYLSKGSGTVYWRLLDPFGAVVFDSKSFTADQGPLTLSQTGAYTLLIEG